MLEVGAGSGYAAAVMGRIADRVYAIERHPSLGEAARRRFATLGYDNIELRIGDGTQGWPEAAPFDAILVAAGGPDVPTGAQAAARGRRPAGHPGRRGSAQQTLLKITPQKRDGIRAGGSRRRDVRAADRRAGLGRGRTTRREQSRARATRAGVPCRK